MDHDREPYSVFLIEHLSRPSRKPHSVAVITWYGGSKVNYVEEAAEPNNIEEITAGSRVPKI
ncbi:MAG: hypothetical protein QXT53_04645 [Ignisphaera sp.]